MHTIVTIVLLLIAYKALRWLLFIPYYDKRINEMVYTRSQRALVRSIFRTRSPSALLSKYNNFVLKLRINPQMKEGHEFRLTYKALTAKLADFHNRGMVTSKHNALVSAIKNSKVGVFDIAEGMLWGNLFSRWLGR